MPPLSYRSIDDPRLRGWIIRERVRCGNPGCHCSTGRKHGPYTYLYFRVFDPVLESYRLRKEYVKPRRVALLRRQIRQAKNQARRQHEALRALLAAF